MIKRFFASIVILFFTTNIFCQEAEWLSGEIYLVDGTVKTGQIKIPQPTKATRIGANKVALRANKKAKTIRFKDKEIDFVNLKSKTGETCKYINILVDNKLALFREVEVLGSLTIYARTMQVGHVSSVGVWFSTAYNEFYAKREGEKNATELLSATRGIGYFQKNVKKYFSNCTEVITASENVEKKDEVLSALLNYKNCI